MRIHVSPLVKHVHSESLPLYIKYYAFAKQQPTSHPTVVDAELRAPLTGRAPLKPAGRAAKILEYPPPAGCSVGMVRALRAPVLAT